MATHQETYDVLVSALYKRRRHLSAYWARTPEQRKIVTDWAHAAEEVLALDLDIFRHQEQADFCRESQAEKKAYCLKKVEEMTKRREELKAALPALEAALPQ